MIIEDEQQVVVVGMRRTQKREREKERERGRTPPNQWIMHKRFGMLATDTMAYGALIGAARKVAV